MRYLLLLSAIFLFSPIKTQSTLDNYILSQMETKHISGLSAVLVKDDDIIWRGNYGLANRELGLAVNDSSIYMLASISKTITATALMQLYEDGLLEMEDDINIHLPFNVFNPNFPDSIITIKQLLTHTSSIRDNWDQLPYFDGDAPITLGDFLYDYLSVDGANYDPSLNFYNYAPETNYNYCNVGIALVGYIVEVLTGTPFNIYCNQNIFEPLCMDNTGWFLSELDTNLIAHPYTYSGGEYIDAGLYGYPDYPDGQLRTTVISLSKFMYMQMQYGNFNGIQILDSATVAYMHSDILPEVVTEQGAVFYSYNEDDGIWWGHSGGDSGVSTDMFFNHTTNTGLIILTNGDANHDNIWYEILEAMDTLAGLSLPVACNIDLPLIIDEDDPVTLKIYPNPANDHIYINDNGLYISEIFTLDGKIVYKSSGINILKIDFLISGMYILKIYDMNNKLIQVQKFIKN